MQEQQIYGINAAQAVISKRPQDVRKIYLLEELKISFSKGLDFARKNKIAYKFVDKNDLEKITGAIHHQGVCVIAVPKKVESLATLCTGAGAGLILAVEGVDNPHNLGAMIRTAAHFGARALVVIVDQNQPPLPKLQGALARVAEGGLESVAVVAEKAATLFKLATAHQWQVYATTPHNGDNLFASKLSSRSILIMGAEGAGLSKSMLKMAPQHLSIPGTGAVESINVGQAATLALGRWYQLWASNKSL